MKNKTFLNNPNELIACIGAINIDRTFKCTHTPSFGESNIATLIETTGGVMYNVAFTLHHLNCKINFVSFTGEDSDSKKIKNQLIAIGLDHSGLINVPNGKTGTYTLVLDNDSNIIIGLSEMSIFQKVDTREIVNAIKNTRAETWVIDSNFEGETLEQLIDSTKEKKLIATAVSSIKAPRLVPVLKHLDCLFLNKSELFSISSGEKSIKDSIEKILKAGTKSVFVTLGPDGAIAANANEYIEAPNFPTVVRDLNGTGDAFCGTAISFLHRNSTTNEALIAGLAASSLLAETDGSTRIDFCNQLIEKKYK